MTTRVRRVLCLSGSLRRRSSNTAVLVAAQRLAMPSLLLELYTGMGALPAFNPDLEMTRLPDSVRHLRSTAESVDALLVACPEYAHGVPGAFKNLLDWLVGSAVFPGTGVLLINTSGRGSHHAQDTLQEILRTMSAQLLSEQPFTVALPAAGCGVEDVLADPARCVDLHVALGHLAMALARQPVDEVP